MATPTGQIVKPAPKIIQNFREFRSVKCCRTFSSLPRNGFQMIAPGDPVSAGRIEIKPMRGACDQLFDEAGLKFARLAAKAST